MKYKIILIEDDETLAEGLQIVLEMEGYSVIHLQDSKKLNQTLKKIVPDIMVIDYRLPGEDGSVIIKKLRQNNKMKKIPIIFMSASQKNMSHMARDIGANEFLAKPFQMEELITMINKYL